MTILEYKTRICGIPTKYKTEFNIDENKELFSLYKLCNRFIGVEFVYLDQEGIEKNGRIAIKIPNDLDTYTVKKFILEEIEKWNLNHV